MAIPVNLLERDEPQVQDLKVVLGDSFRWSGSVTVDGVPQNLTGCTCRCKILSDFGGTLLATMTCTIPDPTNGICLLLMTPAQTAGLPVPTADGGQIGVYDMEILDGTDDTTIVRGNVFALKQVTT